MTGPEFYEKFANFGPFPTRPGLLRKRKTKAPERLKVGTIVYAVYFQSRKLVKIGLTSRPRARFRKLSLSMCDEGFWFAAFAGDRNAERAAHRHFSKWKARGEFFWGSAAFIAELERYVGAQNGRFRPIDLSAPRFT